MILQVFSVFDVAAGAFGRPLFLPAVGLAMRSFSNEVNDVRKDNVMQSHPADFHLFHLGSFDDSSGRFSLLDIPVRITTGSDVKVVS